MAFSICYWADYTQGKTKLSRKSENAVADDWVLKFLYDAMLNPQSDVTGNTRMVA